MSDIQHEYGKNVDKLKVKWILSLMLRFISMLSLFNSFLIGYNCVLLFALAIFLKSRFDKERFNQYLTSSFSYARIVCAKDFLNLCFFWSD